MAPTLENDRSSERDLETVRRLRARDPDGLRRLLEDYGGRARSSLHRDFPEMREFDVDEALNLAAMRVWQCARAYDPARGSLRGWFHVLVRHAAITVLRREARVRRRLEPANPDYVLVPAPPPPDADEALQDDSFTFLADLRGCIDGLSPMQRKIIEADLQAGDVADGDQLARDLQTSRNSVYVTRSTARKALRACLVSKGHAFPETRPLPAP